MTLVHKGAVSIGPETWREGLRYLTARDTTCSDFEPVYEMIQTDAALKQFLLEIE